MKVCESCGSAFSAKLVVDGRMRSLYRRRYCLTCSPFGFHNTSRTPPGSLSADDLAEYRRRRRNAKTYRYQKKRRKHMKVQLVSARGGRCVDCGYAALRSALEFHHRDASGKDFAVSSFGGPWAALLAEAEKCDLVCANCHRVRHAAADALIDAGAVVKYRRNTKLRTVRHMGAACAGCGRGGHPSIFDFHHLDAREKAFGIGQDGIPRRWSKVAAELAKCVMLCANCHREVHAGVRELDEGLLGLAEDALAYVA